MNSFQIRLRPGTGIGRKTTAGLTIRTQETDIPRRDLHRMRIRFILPFHTTILITINPAKKILREFPGIVQLQKREFPLSKTDGFRSGQKRKHVMHSGRMSAPERRTILTTSLAMRPQKIADT